MKQQIIIFDSPDGTGKTQIAKALSREIDVPYFKMTTEQQNWRKGTFREALRFDQTYLLEFLKQTGHSAIIDRAYPAEYVYSKVFNRETDMDVLKTVDQGFSELGARIVIPWRNTYANSRHDDLVPQDKLLEIHKGYEEFSDWTKCRVIWMNVDSLDNDLWKEVPFLIKQLYDK